MARISRAFSSAGCLSCSSCAVDAAGDLVGQFALEPFQEHLLGLLAGQAADLVELLGLLFDEVLDVRARFSVSF